MSRPASANTGWRIKVSGLKGGHSGVDIHQGRGNALRILGGVLQALLDHPPAEISEINGGSAQNAIPREASAVVLLDSTKEKELRSLIAKAESEFKADLGIFDPGLQITAEKVTRPEKVIDLADARRVVDLLVSVPHGVLAMSPDVPGLTQNSTNLATVTTKTDTVEIVTSQRSAIESSKWAAARMVAAVFRLAGFEVEHSGSYPGWKPDPKSDLVMKLQTAHEQVFASACQAHRHACRPGMRSDRGEISGHADGVVWSDHRRSAQSQRESPDLHRREFLELSEGRVRAPLILCGGLQNLQTERYAWSSQEASIVRCFCSALRRRISPRRP